MSGFYSSFLASVNSFLSSKEAIKGIIKNASNKGKGSVRSRVLNSISLNHKLSILYNSKVGATILWKYSSNFAQLMSNPSVEIIKLLSEDEFLKLMDNHADLCASIIESVMLSRIKDADDGKVELISKDIKKMVGYLVKLTKDTKRIIDENELSTPEDIKKNLSKLIGNRETDIYQDILNLTDSILHVVNHNPDAIKDLIYLNILTPEYKLHKEKYQDKVLEVLRSIADDKKTDIGAYFENYRFPGSIGAFLDDYAETYIHQRSLEGIDIDDFNFDGHNFKRFKFSYSRLSKVSFTNVKLLECDFSYSHFTGPIRIINCEIDAATLQTMLPSIRQAQARGISVSINCSVTGKVDLLDLSGIDSSGIRVLDKSVRVVRTSPIVISTSYNEVSERRRIHNFLKEFLPVIDSTAKKLHSRNLTNKHLMSKIESIIYESLKTIDELERDVLIDIINSNNSAKDAFLLTVLADIEEEIRFEHNSRDWFGRAYVEAKLKEDSHSHISEKLKSFVGIIKNDSRYKFASKCKDRRMHEGKVNVVKDRARKEASERFLMLASNGSIKDFFHYNPAKKANLIGKKLRIFFEYLLPTFLKPLVYPEARLGKILETRTLIQAAKILFNIIFHHKEIRKNLSNFMLILDDINMGKTWNSPEQTQRAQINFIKNIVSDNMLSKSFVVYDKAGGFKKDKKGDVIPNENTVDFLYSILDIFISKSDVREFIKDSHTILAILREYDCVGVYENILYVDDPIVQKAELLKLAESISVDDMKKIGKGLSGLRSIITKLSASYSKGTKKKTGSAKPRCYFPHKGTLQKMSRVFALMEASSKESLVDINRRVYKGKKTDFAYGRFNGEEGNVINIRNIRAKHLNATSSVFEYVDFNNCHLTGCSKENKSAFLFLGANFDHAKFSNSSFESVEMQKAYFGSVSLQSCVIKKSDLSGSIFTEAIFRGGLLEDVNMKALEGNGAIFEKSIIKKVNLELAQLCEVSFWNSTISNVSFQNAKMDQVNLTGATLDNCDFTGVDLRTAKLDNIKVTGTLKVSKGCITMAQREFLRKVAGDKLKIVSPETGIKGCHSSRIAGTVAMTASSERGEVGKSS